MHPLRIPDRRFPQFPESSTRSAVQWVEVDSATGSSTQTNRLKRQTNRLKPHDVLHWKILFGNLPFRKASFLKSASIFGNNNNQLNWWGWISLRHQPRTTPKRKTYLGADFSSPLVGNVIRKKRGLESKEKILFKRKIFEKHLQGSAIFCNYCRHLQ